MNWYKSAQFDLEQYLDRQEEINNNLGFPFDREEARRLQTRKEIKKSEKEEKRDISLFRNFDADMDQVEQDERDNLIFSPQKCEQGVLWFAHSLQSNPEQYYNRGGEYLLSFPLTVLYRYTETVYDDGSIRKEPVYNRDEGFENSPRWAGYELPEGFKFSYKTQKHIICEKVLTVPRKYITKGVTG